MKNGDIVELKSRESNRGYPHDKIYVITDFCRMKNSISGEWQDAVIYTRDCKYYVRELDDFFDKFQKVEIWK